MKWDENKISAGEYLAMMKKKDRKHVEPRRIKTNASVIVEGDKMPYKVNVNPLSVNAAWRGQRLKTDDYKAYRIYLLSALPKKIELPTPPFEIHLKFGFSNSLSDWDNGVKPLQDILQEMYGFNDKHIKRAIVEVEETKKNEEYVIFEIVSYKRATN